MKAYKVIALAYSEDGYPRGWYTVGYYAKEETARKAIEEETRKWGKEADAQAVEIKIEEG